jgi:hypothetical protein
MVGKNDREYVVLELEMPERIWQNLYWIHTRISQKKKRDNVKHR